MKKQTFFQVMALILAALFVLALFAGCDGGDPRPAPTKPTGADALTDEDDTDEDDTDEADDTEPPAAQEVRITPAETAAVALETYDNGLVSLKIPKGWKVNVAVTDYIHYTFLVSDPEDPAFLIYFNLKTEGYFKTQQMKDWFNGYYPTSPLSQNPVIDPQTTEQFYKYVWNDFVALQGAQVLPFRMPGINDFTVIESLGRDLLGGEVVRASFTDEYGNAVDGVFTCAIMDVNLYYITCLNVYNTVFYTAPAGELPQWQPILNECVGSVQFSDAFLRGFNAEEDQVMATIRNNARIASEMSDMIMDAWNARQSTYDIISQKQSDATLGYERVYDTETGDIYRATNGFSDYDWGGRYQPATDSMYNEPIDGYIDLK